LALAEPSFLKDRSSPFARYAIDTAGEWLDVEHRGSIERVKPPHAKRSPVASDKLHHAQPDRVGAVGRARSKHPVLPVVRIMGRDRSKRVPLRTVEPAEHDQVRVVLDIRQPGTICFVDDDLGFLIREPSLMGGIRHRCIGRPYDADRFEIHGHCRHCYLHIPYFFARIIPHDMHLIRGTVRQP